MTGFAESRGTDSIAGGCWVDFEGSRDEREGAVVGAVEDCSTGVSEPMEPADDVEDAEALKLRPDTRFCIRFAQRFAKGSLFSSCSTAKGASVVSCS